MLTNQAHSSRRAAAATLLAAVTAIGLAGCGGSEPLSDLADAPAGAAALHAGAHGEAGLDGTDRPEALPSSISDERARGLLDALEQSGVEGQSPATALQLGRGICAQINAGATEDQIIDNLRSVTNVIARKTSGDMSGQEIAQIYVDAAQAHYCS